MAKKQFFLVIDTETTINNHVFDFGAVVVDRQGNSFESCAIIVNDFKNEQLFHDKSLVDGSLWAFNNLQKRHANYEDMLNNGKRMLASVEAINRFLFKVRVKYPEIILTAYNLPFDIDKMNKSGIDISQFYNTVCLWQLANAHFADSKKYKQFVLDNHYFGKKTVKTGSITYLTNAEVMTHFISGIEEKEPHTAFEDLTFEVKILVAIVKRKKWREKSKPYNYRERQLKDNFMAK